MKDNRPVIQREYEIGDDVTLMSTTNAQSHVTYATPVRRNGQIAGYMSVRTKPMDGSEQRQQDGRPTTAIGHPRGKTGADDWASP